MKKIVIAIVTMVALCGVAQAQRHIEFRWHGIYLVGDASYGFNINRSVDKDDTIASTLNAFMPGISVGYQFRKEACIGLGFNYVADPTYAYTQLPIFAELRSHLSRNRLTPYTTLQVGYSLPLGTSSVATAETISSKIEEGGLYFGLEVGARYAINRSTAVAGHVGYRLLHSNLVSRTDLQGHSIVATPIALHVITVGASFYFSN
ncbi:MAG: outer membrane beta-barrel protein [Bacteroidales bacterium]|nr:outer membrane beta-barrel protein [Bacteroidales bacterium]